VDFGGSGEEEASVERNEGGRHGTWQKGGGGLCAGNGNRESGFGYDALMVQGWGEPRRVSTAERAVTSHSLYR
jgi:hypothetical protein